MKRKQSKKPSPSRRTFVGGALLGLAGLSLAGLPVAAAEAPASPTPGKNMKRKGLYPKDAPPADGGYSPGILAEGSKFIFISGQGPSDLKADMETQMRQTFDRIGQIHKEAGGSFENIVIVRSYFVNMGRDLPIFRNVRKEFLVKPYPASSAIGTTELAISGLQIEIEAVAVL
jgi:enamine deaminase RidA (YjgF/YER057c/UK114 family)